MKNLKKMVMLTLVLVMAMTASALAENEEPPTANETEMIENAGQEATCDTTWIPEGAQVIGTLQDELNPNRFITVYASFEGDKLHMGDTVTLIAVLNGYENAAYTAQWQLSTDNAIWQDIGGAVDTSYTFNLNDDNYANYWRIAVIISDVIGE